MASSDTSYQILEPFNQEGLSSVRQRQSCPAYSSFSSGRDSCDEYTLPLQDNPPQPAPKLRNPETKEIKLSTRLVLNVIQVPY